jgi:ABC-type dipeptide/oligopeptide/nickel transport system permease component
LSRAAIAVLTRVLLVIFTFVLIVVLAQIALVAARTRFDHAPLGDVLLQAWEGTQDYFGSLAQGSLGEATTTSILGGRRRSMGEVLLDAYPKSMLLVGLAVTLATVLGVAVGVVAAATRSGRLRAALLGSTMAVRSEPTIQLAILLILLSTEMVRRYNVRLWPSFGFGLDDHLILPTLVLAARPFAQIASFSFDAVDEELGADYVRTARS